MVWLGCALLLTGAMVSPAAAADDIYTRYFAASDGSKPCYGRVYDDAHLKTQAKQTVR